MIVMLIPKKVLVKTHSHESKFLTVYILVLAKNDFFLARHDVIFSNWKDNAAIASYK